MVSVVQEMVTWHSPNKIFNNHVHRRQYFVPISNNLVSIFTFHMLLFHRSYFPLESSIIFFVHWEKPENGYSSSVIHLQIQQYTIKMEKVLVLFFFCIMKPLVHAMGWDIKNGQHPTRNILSSCQFLMSQATACTILKSSYYTYGSIRPDRVKIISVCISDVCKTDMTTHWSVNRN